VTVPEHQLGDPAGPSARRAGRGLARAAERSGDGRRPGPGSQLSL